MRCEECERWEIIRGQDVAAWGDCEKGHGATAYSDLTCDGRDFLPIWEYMELGEEATDD